jgi:hypothetical protein
VVPVGHWRSAADLFSGLDPEDGDCFVSRETDRRGDCNRGNVLDLTRAEETSIDS